MRFINSPAQARQLREIEEAAAKAIITAAYENVQPNNNDRDEEGASSPSRASKTRKKKNAKKV